MSRGPEEFPSTLWDRIAQAREPGGGQAREALAGLCRDYWHPVYAFIRRKGNDPDRAADLTQDVFALLLEPGALDGVSPAKGKFRSYLMAVCSHYLANRRDHDRALKRGGGRTVVSIERLAAEQRYAAEPSHEETSETLF